MSGTQVIKPAFAPGNRASKEILQEQVKQMEKVFTLEPLLSAMPNPVTILNKNRQIVYANPAFRQILGFNDNGEIFGLRLGEAVQCLHASESKEGCGTTEFCSQCGAAKAMRKAISGQADVQECRILAHREDEVTAVDLRVWATPFQIGDEKFTIFSMADISDEKRRRVLERIFFHDITNTATAIQGLVDLFLVSENPADLLDLSVDKMLANASIQLIDEIQAQSQLMDAESGELDLQNEPFETKTFLQQMVELYHNHRVADGRQIQLADPVPNVFRWSDWALLGRVIGNMLKNALEASTPGETITVGCEEYFDHVRFWVHNPKLIPRHVQLQIFKRSFSTKGDGRGLGTYSMKLLAENYLEGQISFESTPEKGTIFFCTLPKEIQGVNSLSSPGDLV